MSESAVLLVNIKFQVMYPSLFSDYKKLGLLSALLCMLAIRVGWKFKVLPSEFEFPVPYYVLYLRELQGLDVRMTSRIRINILLFEIRQFLTGLKFETSTIFTIR